MQTHKSTTQTHSHTAKLLERFYDKEEKVRMEVVKAISEAASDNMQSVPDSVRYGVGAAD